MRQDHFPPGWQICLTQFLELFHRFGYIYKPLAGGSWFSADEKWRLTDSEVLKAIACSHPRFFLGCRAGKSTRFAVLDIDANSRYHNKASLDKLLKVLAEAGLGRSSLYRSSHSGGWHLYIFFDEPVNSADLRRQLLRLLTVHDFDVGKGMLEVFPHPSQSSLGMGLRLPLQPGFAWLSKETLAVEHDRSELDATAALELFLDALDGDSNPYASFRWLKGYLDELERCKASIQAQARAAGGETDVVPIRRVVESSGDFTDFVRAVFQKLPPGIISDTWYKGRLFHLNGLTAPSQRAEAIFCIGHYLFYGDPSRDLPAVGYGYEQEREWAIKEFLSLHHNGQSKDINHGRADALAQVERATQWKPAHREGTDSKKYSAKRPVSWVRENANRKIGARKRITDALEGLKKLRRSFTTVELQEAAGCSRETLYNHTDIWRKDYEDLAEGFFAICTDEYNAVLGAAAAQSAPPDTSSASDMPPGRLAARRIVYELSMRADRDKKQSHKKAVRSQEAFEKEWRGNVTRLTEAEPASLSLAQLKALLTVLAAYMSQAPNEEAQKFLQTRINRIRETLSKAVDKPPFIVRPP